MSYGIQAANVPSHEVLWIATYARGRRPRFFRAKLWIVARDLAMKSFACEAHEITLELA